MNLRVLDGFDLDAPLQSRGPRVVFESGLLTDGRLTLRASYPGPRDGAIASAAGLAASVLFFAWHARRERSR